MKGVIIRTVSDNRKNIKLVLLIFFIYTFTFQNVLQNYIFGLKYFDEFFAILFFPVILVKIAREKKIRLPKRLFCFFLSMIFFILAGMIGNLRYSFVGKITMLQDILLNAKFMLALIVSYWFFDNLEYVKVRSYIAFHIKTITLFLFTMMIMDYTLGIFPSDVRYGMRSLQLFYGHPSYLSGAVAFLSIVLLSLEDMCKKQTIYILVMQLLMLCMTLRSRTIAFVLVLILASWYIIKKNKKLVISRWFVLGATSVVLGWTKIEGYFIQYKGTGARSALLIYSLIIAKDSFPFGTGFGTYASAPSVTGVYSPVYYLYNINRIWGLSPENTSFASDSFWPMILGQTGIVGIVFFVMALWFLFGEIQSIYQCDLKMYLAATLGFAYLILSSISESAFVNPVAIPLAMWIGILVTFSKNKRRRGFIVE